MFLVKLKRGGSENDSAQTGLNLDISLSHTHYLEMFRYIVLAIKDVNIVLLGMKKTYLCLGMMRAILCSIFQARDH